MWYEQPKQSIYNASPTSLWLSFPCSHLIELLGMCCESGNPRPVEGAVEAGVVTESAVTVRL